MAISGQLVNSAYAVFGTVAVPALLLRGLWDKAWRESLPERLGSGRWTKGELERSIWFHAASVGEVVSLEPLLREFVKRYPSIPLLITTTSTTGQQKAESLGLASAVRFLPFDHPLCIRQVLSSFNPLLFVCNETEIWPSLLKALRARRVPSLLINGRISDTSYPGYQRIKPLLKDALRSFDLVLAQTEKDRQRLISLGGDSASCTIAGSTKYDATSSDITEEQVKDFRRSVGIDESSSCIVAGSVREGEDEIVLRAYKFVLQAAPETNLIVAPRHPERFEAVASLLGKHGFSFKRRSKPAEVGDARVVLLDTLGELRMAYSIATIAFVGGTLVDIGGHNPFEPAMFGVPVFVGSYSYKIAAEVALLRDHGGIREVSGEEELGRSMLDVLSAPERVLEMGKGAKRAWQESRGATERVLEAMAPYLKERRDDD